MSKKPKRIKDIDGENINRLVNTIGITVALVGHLIEDVRDRGLVITPTIFDVKVSFTIKLGPKE